MSDPALLIYTKDFISGTADMEANELGVYVRLLFFQHQNDGVPDSVERMARIGGVSVEEFNKIWIVLKGKFRETKDGRLFNKRLTIEMGKRNNSSKLKTILGIFGNIVKNSDYTKDQKNAIKSSFNADDFIEVPENQIKEEILSSLERTLSVRINIANADEDAISFSSFLKGGVGENSFLPTNKLDPKISKAIKKVDKAGKVSIDDVEIQFFPGKGTEFVIEKFQAYFQEIDYSYKSEYATQRLFEVWTDKLKREQISGELDKKIIPAVKMTADLEVIYSKFQEMRLKVGLLANFLWQEMPEDKSAYYKSLLKEFGLKGTVRKIATYDAKTPGGPGRNKWTHFQAQIDQLKLTEEEYQEICKGQGIEF